MWEQHKHPSKVFLMQARDEREPVRAHSWEERLIEGAEMPLEVVGLLHKCNGIVNEDGAGGRKRGREVTG